MFLHKAMVFNTATSDYGDLKEILTSELEKYRNESSYEKFDWQINDID